MGQREVTPAVKSPPGYLWHKQLDPGMLVPEKDIRVSWMATSSSLTRALQEVPAAPKTTKGSIWLRDNFSAHCLVFGEFSVPTCYLKMQVLSKDFIKNLSPKQMLIHPLSDGNLCALGRRNLAWTLMKRQFLGTRTSLGIEVAGKGDKRSCGQGHIIPRHTQDSFPVLRTAGNWVLQIAAMS